MSAQDSIIMTEEALSAILKQRRLTLDEVFRAEHPYLTISSNDSTDTSPASSSGSKGTNKGAKGKRARDDATDNNTSNTADNNAAIETSSSCPSSIHPAPTHSAPAPAHRSQAAIKRSAKDNLMRLPLQYVALHLAISNGRCDIVELLVEGLGFNPCITIPNFTEEEREKQLCWIKARAAQTGQPEAMVDRNPNAPCPIIRKNLLKIVDPPPPPVTAGATAPPALHPYRIVPRIDLFANDPHHPWFHTVEHRCDDIMLSDADLRVCPLQRAIEGAKPSDMSNIGETESELDEALPMLSLLWKKGWWARRSGIVFAPREKDTDPFVVPPPTALELYRIRHANEWEWKKSFQQLAVEHNELLLEESDSLLFDRFFNGGDNNVGERDSVMSSFSHTGPPLSREQTRKGISKFHLFVNPAVYSPLAVCFNQFRMQLFMFLVNRCGFSIQSRVCGDSRALNSPGTVPIEHNVEPLPLLFFVSRNARMPFETYYEFDKLRFEWFGMLIYKGANVFGFGGRRLRNGTAQSFGYALEDSDHQAKHLVTFMAARNRNPRPFPLQRSVVEVGKTDDNTHLLGFLVVGFGNRQMRVPDTRRFDNIGSSAAIASSLPSYTPITVRDLLHLPNHQDVTPLFEAVRYDNCEYARALLWLDEARILVDHVLDPYYPEHAERVADNTNELANSRPFNINGREIQPESVGSYKMNTLLYSARSVLMRMLLTNYGASNDDGVTVLKWLRRMRKNREREERRAAGQDYDDDVVDDDSMPAKVLIYPPHQYTYSKGVYDARRKSNDLFVHKSILPLRNADSGFCRKGRFYPEDIYPAPHYRRFRETLNLENAVRHIMISTGAGADVNARSVVYHSTSLYKRSELVESAFAEAAMLSVKNELMAAQAALSGTSLATAEGDGENMRKFSQLASGNTPIGRLLSNGADPTLVSIERGPLGASPLHLAVEESLVETARQLLKPVGFDTTYPQQQQRTEGQRKIKARNTHRGVGGAIVNALPASSAQAPPLMQAAMDKYAAAKERFLVDELFPYFINVNPPAATNFRLMLKTMEGLRLASRGAMLFVANKYNPVDPSLYGYESSAEIPKQLNDDVNKKDPFFIQLESIKDVAFESDYDWLETVDTCQRGNVEKSTPIEGAYPNEDLDFRFMPRPTLAGNNAKFLNTVSLLITAGSDVRNMRRSTECEFEFSVRKDLESVRNSSNAALRARVLQQLDQREAALDASDAADRLGKYTRLFEDALLSASKKQESAPAETTTAATNKKKGPTLIGGKRKSSSSGGAGSLLSSSSASSSPPLLDLEWIASSNYRNLQDKFIKPALKKVLRAMERNQTTSTD